MLILRPEPLDFKISTTDLEVKYTERTGVKIRLDVVIRSLPEKDEYREVEVAFSHVAELKCTTLNFYEAEYGQFEVMSHVPDSGFYEVLNSERLKLQKDKYDPKNRLNLKHYIITGNDSYVEMIAAEYCISFAHL